MKVKFVGNAQSDTKFLQPSCFQLLWWKLMFTVEPILWFERLYISLVEATMLHSVIQLGREPKHPKPNGVIFVEWMDVDLVALEEIFVQFGSCMRLYKVVNWTKRDMGNVTYAGIHGRCMDRGSTQTQDLHRTLATERWDLAGKLVQGPAICGCFNGRNSSDFDAIFWESYQVEFWL